MRSDEDRQASYFAHHTLERLLIVDACHQQSEGRGLDADSIETIEDAKFLFRDFLEKIVTGLYAGRRPQCWTMDSIRNAYRMSGFDWTRKEQYEQFFGWWCDSAREEAEDRNPY